MTVSNEQLATLIKQINQLTVTTRSATLPPDQVFRFNHRGQMICLYLPNTLHDGVQQIILRTGDFFEAGMLHKLRGMNVVGDQSTVIDIGANIGNHSVYFSKVLGAARVISFEPQDYCYRVLNENLRLNDISNVTTVECCVGIKTGNAQLSRFKPGNYGATAFEVSQTGAMRMVSLDDYVTDAGLQNIDFVKIDVEGHAAEVIAGARETLTTFKPVVWAELLPRFGEVEPTIKLLSELGYSVAEQFSRVDFLFHHKDCQIT